MLVCGYEEGEPEDWAVSQPDGDTVVDAGYGVDAEEDTGAAEHSAEPEYIWVPHMHTADCYEEVTTEVPVLTCTEEEHVHADDCFDPEDGSLICDKFEHTHDDSCYTIEYETEEQLVCGLEEGELVEELNPDYNPVAMFEAPAAAAKPVVVAPVAEGPVHHHTDACYAPDYTADPICGKEEHHHTVNCLSDPLDGVEDESDWLAKTDTNLTGMWPEDLVTVAKSQLGYEQSEKNFELDPADGVTVRHYTRYGQWYGNPYGAWDVMFLSYCLNYAGAPQTVVPQRAGTQALRSELRGSDWLKDAADVEQILPGDIVFYDASTTETVTAPQQPAVSDDSPDADIALLSMEDAAAETEAPQTEEQTVTAETVGIVSDADEAGNLTVISGSVDGKVAEVSLTSADVTGVIDLAAAPVLSIVVQLCRYTEGQTAADAKVADNRTLTAGDDWTYTWAGENEIPSQDENGNKYYYFVKEVTTGLWNVKDRNNNGVQTGEITLFNYVYTGYELPSTGGSGTAPFAAAGGALMALSLIGGAVLVLKKRKTH